MNFALATRALRSRNYKLFFTGQGISLIGTWMTRIAMSWLVYRLTGSAALLGLVVSPDKFRGSCSALWLVSGSIVGTVTAPSFSPRFSQCCSPLHWRCLRWRTSSQSEKL